MSVSRDLEVCEACAESSDKGLSIRVYRCNGCNDFVCAHNVIFGLKTENRMTPEPLCPSCQSFRNEGAEDVDKPIGYW